MVERSVLMQEIDSLPPRYYAEVIDFVSFLKEKKVNKSLLLEKAAEAAAEEYLNDRELTAFSVLDGEDFDEAR